jgi:hypothetical protein
MTVAISYYGVFRNLETAAVSKNNFLYFGETVLYTKSHFTVDINLVGMFLFLIMCAKNVKCNLLRCFKNLLKQTTKTNIANEA